MHCSLCPQQAPRSLPLLGGFSSSMTTSCSHRHCLGSVPCANIHRSPFRIRLESSCVGNCSSGFLCLLFTPVSHSFAVSFAGFATVSRYFAQGRSQRFASFARILHSFTCRQTKQKKRLTHPLRAAMCDKWQCMGSQGSVGCDQDACMHFNCHFACKDDTFTAASSESTKKKVAKKKVVGLLQNSW